MLNRIESIELDRVEPITWGVDEMYSLAECLNGSNTELGYKILLLASFFEDKVELLKKEMENLYQEVGKCPHRKLKEAE